MKPHEILTCYDFWKDAPDGFRAELERTGRFASLQEGAWYFQEGDACTAAALVGQGSVRVFKRSESGREITLYHVGPGEMCLLTLHCALNGTEYPGSGIVEHDLEALLFPITALRAWAEDHPFLRRFVLASMSRRLVDLITLVEEVAFRSMDQRLARYLQEQFSDADALETTHAAVAAELGTVREVVTRLLRDMERVGAVETARGRIHLRDRAELARLSGTGV